MNDICPVRTILRNLDLVFFSMSTFPKDPEAGDRAALLQIDDIPLIIVTSGSPARILVAVNGIFRSQARISF